MDGVMDLALHPKLVHLPIALAILMPLFAGGLLFAWWRGWLPRRTWLVVVALQGILLGSGLLAQRTGEGDEERVEAFVPEAALEAHEEAATVFLAVSAVVLVLAGAAALLRPAIAARTVAAAAAAGTLVVVLLGYRVGEAGGRLVYDHGAAAAYTSLSLVPQGGSHDDD